MKNSKTNENVNEVTQVTSKVEDGKSKFEAGIIDTNNEALSQANQSNDFKEFLNDEFGKIRALNINGEPWFVGKDVATSLGYADPRGTVSKKVEADDRGVAEMETPSGKQKMTIINESGLYNLIFGSKLETAKQFKHWVTSEVLPAIRKTGKYSLPEPKADSYLIEDPAARARRWAEEYEEKKQLLLENNELKPKAKDWEQFLDTKGTFSILDIAHAMNIGRSTLFAMLRDVKICFKNEREENIPYEKPVHKDKFTTCIVHKNGVPCTQMRVYPKGLSYITKKLREKGYIDGDKEKYILSYFKTLEEQKSYSACAIA